MTDELTERLTEKVRDELPTYDVDWPIECVSSAIIEAVLAEIAAAGMVVVPRKLTKEMRAAWLSAEVSLTDWPDPIVGRPDELWEVGIATYLDANKKT